MADYLDHLLYEEDKGISDGRNAFSDMAAIYPEMRGHMSSAFRAIQSWGRLELGREGRPCTWEEVCAVAQVLQVQGFQVESDLALICADCYLRQPDWKLLRVCDVAVKEGRWKKAQQLKQGERQGVVVDYTGGKAFGEVREGKASAREGFLHDT